MVFIVFSLTKELPIYKNSKPLLHLILDKLKLINSYDILYLFTKLGKIFYI